MSKRIGGDLATRDVKRLRVDETPSLVVAHVPVPTRSPVQRVFFLLSGICDKGDSVMGPSHRRVFAYTKGSGDHAFGLVMTALQTLSARTASGDRLDEHLPVFLYLTGQWSQERPPRALPKELWLEAPWTLGEWRELVLETTGPMVINIGPQSLLIIYDVWMTPVGTQWTEVDEQSYEELVLVDQMVLPTQPLEIVNHYFKLKTMSALKRNVIRRKMLRLERADPFTDYSDDEEEKEKVRARRRARVAVAPSVQ